MVDCGILRPLLTLMLQLDSATLDSRSGRKVSVNQSSDVKEEMRNIFIWLACAGKKRIVSGSFPDTSDAIDEINQPVFDRRMRRAGKWLASFSTDKLHNASGASMVGTLSDFTLNLAQNYWLKIGKLMRNFGCGH